MVKDVKDTLTQDMFGDSHPFVENARQAWGNAFLGTGVSWLEFLLNIKATLDMEIERLKVGQE